MTREEARAIMTLLKQSYINFRTKSDLRKKTVKENIKAYDMAIKALEHPERNVVAVVPCGDTISRQAVQDYIAKYLSQYLYNDVRETVEVIDEYIGELPSVNPQEQKTGHWIEKDGFDGDVYYDCSECGESWTTIEGTPWDNEWNYCPNCGCRMVEGSDKE